MHAKENMRGGRER